MATLILVLALVAGFGALIHYVRRDGFTGPRTPTGDHPQGVAAGQDVLR